MKLGFAGLGRWGKNLLRAAHSVDGIEVAALCDPDTVALARASKGIRFPHDAWSRTGLPLYSDFGKMLSYTDLDAVVIATPPRTHVEFAAAALDAGKHVCIEKPMAMSMYGVENLRPHVGASRRTFMVGHVFLYNDLVRWLKEYVDDGGLGRILYVTGAWLNWGTVRSDVDAFWNFAQHPLSILLHLFGFPPQDVWWSGPEFLQPGIADAAFLTARFGTSHAQIAMSWLSPRKVRQLYVVGERAGVVFDDVTRELRVVEGDSSVREFDTFGQFQLIRKAGRTLIPLVNYREPLVNEMRHFLECCETGKEPLTGFEHGAEITRIMEQAVRL